MSLKGQHILSSAQFDMPLLDELYGYADTLAPVARGQMTTDVLRGAVLGSIFFEPSTRTRLSFDAAFMRLGGSVSNTTGVEFSSVVKGESLEDTARVVGGYMDTLVVRHFEEKAIHQFAASTNIPVINGGNGSGEHPTQALLDLYTIRTEFKRLNKKLDGCHVTMAGDLRYGRTIHSLIRLLSLYKGLTFTMVAPKGLEIPQELVEAARAKGHAVKETHNLEEGLAKADLLYTTRIQKERMSESEKAANEGVSFRITKDLADRAAPKDVIIMHPLPRDSRPGANDLSNDFDNSDPRLAIFRQTDAGIPVRMALFCMVLGVESSIKASLKPASWWRPDAIANHDAEFYKIKRI
ncbi:MAG: aspartate carbamoyltransferase [Bdellovibrionales bacterium]